MSYPITQTADKERQFLASSVGLVTKTCQFETTDGADDGHGHKIVKSGTIHTDAEREFVGIVFESVDVTEGAALGSLVVAGRIDPDALETTPTDEQETAMKAQGIVFEARAFADREPAAEATPPAQSE